MPAAQLNNICREEIAIREIPCDWEQFVTLLRLPRNIEAHSGLVYARCYPRSQVAWGSCKLLRSVLPPDFPLPKAEPQLPPTQYSKSILDMACILYK